MIHPSLDPVAEMPARHAARHRALEHLPHNCRRLHREIVAQALRLQRAHFIRQIIEHERLGVKDLIVAVRTVAAHRHVLAHTVAQLQDPVTVIAARTRPLYTVRTHHHRQMPVDGEFYWSEDC